MFDIEGKKVILTGGVKGIGLSIVEAFYNAGTEIAVIDVSDDIYSIHEALNNDGSRLHYIQTDLTNSDLLKEAYETALARLDGKVDILINNAGMILRKPAMEFPLDVWHKIYDLNVTSLFELSRLAAVNMIKQRSGKIINMASIAAVAGSYNNAPYSASKGAVLQLTKSLSNEWAEYGIQVNAIAPGVIKTEMNQEVMDDPERLAQFNDRIPAKRLGTPEEVAGTALFLASSASDYITGALIPVDGGFLGR
ncbi:SDR family NAD(P)-dependent oxidoreductase [Lacicoccus alkaliphilus]|uniref:2-deoxy-D-gluconate 3-dehydrogenase n=1 Tax=Lacicoccus alkaliphilus DSM 16010 TaxID=1123231 RepID=A0A1M7CYY4_9BACL|nr:glucose 1-dehydrogenase [Salinicoccus alkaliphilus]SHL72405.1 2-deoxy-D-gluconate 3-dehydrogenase [Salinicoccus alkaliphilus DSM 16010]